MTLKTRQRITAFFSSIGGMLTIIELICYITIFHYLAYHNNNVASAVLSDKVIKQRNKANAISFFGQFAAWIMKVWYVILFGILYAANIGGTAREISILIKDFEFILIPLVEIYTSPPIKFFMLHRLEIPLSNKNKIEMKLLGQFKAD